jgi:hypothetical protein
MGSNKKNNILRNYKRFKVKKNFLMQIRGLLSLRCKIIDISRGGLAFIYNDDGNRPGKKVVLDIFMRKNEYIIKNLSVKIISDSPVSQRPIFSFRKKRKCRAQFVGLIHNQAVQLEYFIRNCTNGEE